MKHHKEAEDGLTIIEILMAMAVITILSGIAVPAFVQFLPDYRLSVAAGDLYANLQRAKHEAVRANGECAVYFDTEKGRYQLVSGGADGICDGAPAGTAPIPQNDDILLNCITLLNYGSGVRYGSGSATKTVPGQSIPPDPIVTYGNNRVRFDAKGMVREMGYVYLTNINGKAYAIGTPSWAGAIVLKKWLTCAWD